MLPTTSRLIVILLKGFHKNTKRMFILTKVVVRITQTKVEIAVSKNCFNSDREPPSPNCVFKKKPQFLGNFFYRIFTERKGGYPNGQQNQRNNLKEGGGTPPPFKGSFNGFLNPSLKKLAHPPACGACLIFFVQRIVFFKVFIQAFYVQLAL